MNLKGSIIYRMNQLVRKGNWYNEMMFPDCKKLWEYNTFNTDVINLGSSSGLHAFDYEGLPVRGANLALQRNPLSADFAILKNYFGYLKPQGGVVIICLCPFSSLAGSYEFTDDRYYSLLYASSIPNFSYKREQMVKSIKNNPLYSYPLMAMLSDIRSYLHKKETEDVLTENQMEQDAHRWMDGWLTEFGLSDLSAPLSLMNRDGIQDAVKILNDMVDFCLERNLRPILLIPPVYHTLGDLFSKSLRQVIIAPLIKGLKTDSVWYHNYMDDKEFSHDLTLFKNSFFLNKRGRELFTKRVLGDIGLLS